MGVLTRNVRWVLAGSLVFGGALAVSLVRAPSATAATFQVNTCANSGTGSLPAAVASATAGDTITFNPTLSCPPSSPIILTSELDIGQSLTITGPGPGTMAVSNASGVSGGGIGIGPAVFGIEPGETVAISGLTIENSFVGITNEGALTVTDSTISGNNTTIPGLPPGPIPGGIFNLSVGVGTGDTLNVTDSTISGNTSGGVGGGIFNLGGAVNVTDSTISGNTAPLGGGGIFSLGLPTNLTPVNVTDSTISGNTVSGIPGFAGSGAGGGILGLFATVNVTDSTISGNTAGAAGGIVNDGPVNVGASIVAGNSAGQFPNCGVPTTSLGYNLTNDTTAAQCGFTQPTDVVNADPMLGTLAPNGGPTFTMLPASGSPEIGKIPPGTTLSSVPVCPRTDQRGVASTPGANCDIGAVEGSTVPTTTGAGNASATYSPSDQGVTLSATVTSTRTVNEGTVAFSVFNGTTQIGSTVTSGTVSNGSASATFTLPGGTSVNSYTIDATYNGTGNFTTSSGSGTLAVSQATPTITWANPPDITFGTALGKTQLDASANVGGTFVYTPPATTILPVGNNQTLSTTFTPTDTTDYTTASSSVSINVINATPIITWSNQSITWGTKLSSGTAPLNATANVAGSFSYTLSGGANASGAVLAPGPQTVKATFTPTDTADYTTATKSVSITVVFNPASCITRSTAGPLVVNSGQAYCVTAGATITNGVTVNTGGALFMMGGTIKGSLTATGASAVSLCGVTIAGGLTITGSTGPLTIGSSSCSNNMISGSVLITGNTGGVRYIHNSVRGAVTITNNSGGFSGYANLGNTTTGSVTVKNNTT